MNRPTWKDLGIERREAHSFFSMARDLVIETNKSAIEIWFELVVDLLYKHGYTVNKNIDSKQPKSGD